MLRDPCGPVFYLQYLLCGASPSDRRIGVRKPRAAWLRKKALRVQVEGSLRDAEPGCFPGGVRAPGTLAARHAELSFTFASSSTLDYYSALVPGLNYRTDTKCSRIHTLQYTLSYTAPPAFDTVQWRGVRGLGAPAQQARVVHKGLRAAAEARRDLLSRCDHAQQHRFGLRVSDSTEGCCDTQLCPHST